MYQGVYELYGVELSFFTRKLEAQLRFQNVPWRYRFRNDERDKEVGARAGTHFIPVLITPDGWMIADTIALGPMLNDRFSNAPVIPATPQQRAACFVLEDVFNHWLGRVAMHTRWCYPDNVAWVGPRFGANVVLDRSIDEPLSEAELDQLAPIGDFMYQGFGKQGCEFIGVGPDQAEAVKADYLALMEVLAQHFEQQDFLLGARPCLADFALAGASKAHFICDPVPLEWLGEYRPMLEAYTERVFNADTNTGNWMAEDALPASLNAILAYADKTYAQYVTANIAAATAAEKYFDYDFGYGHTQARTQKRLNKARLHVQDELNKIEASKPGALGTALGQLTLLDYYLAD
jgi:glutathione S-transferase